MEKLKRWIRNNLLFFISLILLGASLAYTTAILIEFKIASQLESTRVGYIYLGNNKSAYESTLNQQILTFYNVADYKITYQNQELEINLDYFDFDISSTTLNIVANQNNPAFFNITDANKNLFEDDILSTFGEDVYDELDIDLMITSIMSQMSSLEYVYTISLCNFFQNGSSDNILISKMHVITQPDILFEIESLDVLEIEGYSYFSLLEKTKEYDFENSTLSFIASAIVNLLQETHISNFTFNSFEELPSWASPGMNVKILQINNFDLGFYNSFKNTYKIYFTVTNNSIKIDLVGLPFVNEYSVTNQLTVIPYSSIYIDDPLLTQIAYKVSETDTEILYQKIMEPGVNGQVSTFVRTITNPQGEAKTEIIFYEKTNSIPEVVAENVIIKAGG